MGGNRLFIVAVLAVLLLLGGGLLLWMDSWAGDEGLPLSGPAPAPPPAPAKPTTPPIQPVEAPPPESPIARTTEPAAPEAVTEAEPGETPVELPPPEELRRRMDELRAKLHDGIWRHSPTGTGLEAFFLTLPDDGESFALISSVGGAVREAEDNEDSPLKASNLAMSAGGARGVAHLNIRTELAAALPVLEGLLKPLLTAELPPVIYMMPTRQARDAGEMMPGIVEMIRVMDALRLLSLAQLRTGQQEAGVRSMERLIAIGLGLRGTSLLDLMLTRTARQKNVQFLTGCLEAKLLDKDFVRRMTTLAAASGHDWESVLMGEGIRALSQLDEILKSDEWQSAQTPEELLEWIDAGDSITVWVIDALDPESVLGRIYRGGKGLRVADLESLKVVELLARALEGVFIEQAHWDVLESLGEAETPWDSSHTEDTVSLDMRHLMRMLGGEGSCISYGGGGSSSGGGMTYRNGRREPRPSSRNYLYSECAYYISESSPALQLFAQLRQTSVSLVLPAKLFSRVFPRGTQDTRLEVPPEWLTGVFAGSPEPVQLVFVSSNGDEPAADPIPKLAWLITDYTESQDRDDPSPGG